MAANERRDGKARLQQKQTDRQPTYLSKEWNKIKTAVVGHIVHEEEEEEEEGKSETFSTSKRLSFSFTRLPSSSPFSPFFPRRSYKGVRKSKKKKKWGERRASSWPSLEHFSSHPIPACFVDLSFDRLLVVIGFVPLFWTRLTFPEEEKEERQTGRQAGRQAPSKGEEIEIDNFTKE